MKNRPDDPIEEQSTGHHSAYWDGHDAFEADESGDSAGDDGSLAGVAIEIEGELVDVLDAAERGTDRLENERAEQSPGDADGQVREANSTLDGDPPPGETRIAGRQDPVLLLTLSPAELEVQPGASVELQVQLLNNGNRVALFEVLFEGWIDSAWLDVNPIYRTLQPGERVTVSMNISPPCRPSALAGSRQLVVVVRSPDYPGRESRQVGLLNVLPYDDVQIGAMAPSTAEISWGQRIASFEVPVTNNGNHVLQARIRGQSEAADFHFDPVDSEQIETGPFVAEDLLLTLDPGQSKVLSGTIRSKRLPLFSMKPRMSRYRILVNVVGKTQVPRAATGQLSALPLIGPRRVALLTMILMFVLVAISLLGATGFGLVQIVSSLPAASSRVDGQSSASLSATQPPIVAVVVPVGMPVPTTSSGPAVGSTGPIVVSVGEETGGNLGEKPGENVTSARPGVAGESAGRDLSVPLVAAGEVSRPGTEPGFSSSAPVPAANQSADIAPPPAVGASPTPDRSDLTYAQMFQEVALRYDLDWRMLAAQAYVESSFDTLALGSDGDLGLMQVLPRTWKEWAPAVDVNDPFDAYSNVLVAGVYLDYLRSTLSRTGYPEARWMLVAYNWGPDKLNIFLAEGNGWDDLPDSVRRYAGDILRIAESIP